MQDVETVSVTHRLKKDYSVGDILSPTEICSRVKT